MTLDGLEQQKYCCLSEVKGDCDFCLPYNYTKLFDGIIQLRKDGKDLYSLEWRRPTEQDIGKMCWFADVCFDDNKRLHLDSLYGIENTYLDTHDNGFEHCLLADHGQLAPTEEDFKRIYGWQ